MINKIKQFINQSETIAVLCHINADGDALCSCFAIADVLAKMGKQVTCLLDEYPGPKYDFLGGEYEVFDDSKDYKFHMSIAVDCGGKERLGKRVSVFDKSKYTLNIDHHKSNDNFAQINIVKPDYCAAAEVLAELFAQMGLDISDKTARFLYGGIMSDSGCLKYSSTSPSTLRIVADLMEHGFDHAEMTRMLFDSKSMALTKLTGHVMNNVESFEDGKITLICTDAKLLEKYGVDESDANDLINIPRSISGTEIAMEVKERGGVVRVSIRSNGVAEVDKIAAQFGGGGHIRAAGATLNNMTLQQAKNEVLAAACKELVRCGI